MDLPTNDHSTLEGQQVFQLEQRGGDLRRVPGAVPNGGHIDIVPTYGDSAKEDTLCSMDLHLQEDIHWARCIYKSASLGIGPTGPMDPMGEDLDRSSSVQRNQNAQ